MLYFQKYANYELIELHVCACIMYMYMSIHMHVSCPGDAAKSDGEATKSGVENFWLIALKNCEIFSEVIKVRTCTLYVQCVW